MNTISKEIMAIGVLIACEETLGQLYDFFAEQSSELYDFWKKIAAEERAHASWLRNLVSHLRDQTLSYKEDRFQPEIFRTFHQYLQERLSYARTNKLTNVIALSIALDCEGTFVEKNFFQVLEGDTPALRTVLHNLAVASEKHCQEVKDMWERYRLQGKA